MKCNISYTYDNNDDDYYNKYWYIMKNNREKVTKNLTTGERNMINIVHKIVSYVIIVTDSFGNILMNNTTPEVIP